MLMDPNSVNPPNSYVDPMASGYNAPPGPVSNRSKFIVVGMILGILILVIGGFLFISSRKDPNVASMEKIVGVHAEIVRISDLALESEISSPKGKDIAATAKATSSSNQQVATLILTDDYNGEATKEVVGGATDQANDDKIKQGELLGNVDRAYFEVLKALLIQANAAIVESGGNEEVKTKLEAMAASNEQVFNSIPAAN